MARRAPSTPSLDVYRARLRRVRRQVERAGASALLVTHPIDVGYLTGFLGGESHVIVPRAGKPLVVSDFRYQEELEPVRPIAKVVIRDRGMHEAVGLALRQLKASRVAVQGEWLSVSDFHALSQVLDGVELVPTTGVVGGLREIKDEVEIETMRRATRIQERALQALLAGFRERGVAGRTELDIAAELEAHMKVGGSSQAWFQSIVAAGPNGSLPHYRPAAVKVKENSSLLIDWGATYNGYSGDMTRTFGVGRWPAKVREIFEIVLDAQEMAAAALGPGKTAHEIDAIARKHIAKHGYGEQFGHGLGHGLGMSKERPYLNPLYPDMELRPGHMCTIEPGIYLPGVGGVRIEDLYVVREKGAENLCSLPKDLAWSTI